MYTDRKKLASNILEVAKVARDLGQLETAEFLHDLSGIITRSASKYYFRVQPGGFGIVPDNEYVEFDSEEEVMQYAADVVQDKTIPTFEIARRELLEIGNFGDMETPLLPNVGQEPEVEDKEPQEEEQIDPRRESSWQAHTASLRFADVEGLEDNELMALRNLKRKEDLLVLDLEEMYQITPRDLYGELEPGKLEPSVFTKEMSGPESDQLEILIRRANELVDRHLDLVKKIFPKLPIRGDLPLRAISKKLKNFGQDL